MSGWATTAGLLEVSTGRPVPARRSIHDQMDAIVAERVGGISHVAPMGLPAVFATVRLIASTIQQLPVVAPGDPLWLRRPRSAQASLDLSDLIQYLVVSMATRGTAYVKCRRVGEAWRLDALDGEYVQPVSVPGPVVNRMYRVAGEPMDRVPVFAKDIVDGRDYLLVVPYLVTPEHPEGTSPLTECRVALEGYADTETAASGLIAGGTHAGGVLSTDQPIVEETARRYQSKWAEDRRTGKIPVLGGGLHYENVTVSPRDAQFIESRSFSMQQIFAMFGVPPDMLGTSLIGGQSSLSYQNAQDSRIRYRQNCLEAFTVQLEDSLSLLLPPGRNSAEDQRVTFDYTGWEAAGATDNTPPGIAADGT